LQTYEICFGNKIHIKKDGYSIKSTGFTIDGVSEVIYMADVQVSENTGKIFFFKLENNIPVLVKNTAGSVDYGRGEILLDVVNITSSSLSNGFIEIQAIPESK